MVRVDFRKLNLSYDMTLYFLCYVFFDYSVLPIIDKAYIVIGGIPPVITDTLLYDIILPMESLYFLPLWIILFFVGYLELFTTRLESKALVSVIKFICVLCFIFVMFFLGRPLICFRTTFC